MRKISLFFLALIVIGIGYQHYSSEMPIPAVSSDINQQDIRHQSIENNGIPHQFEQQLRALTQRLEEESRLRQALAQQVTQLQQQLSSQQSMANSVTSVTADPVPLQTAATSYQASQQQRQKQMGLSKQQMDDYAVLLDQRHLALSELRITARREGWYQTERYHQAMNQLIVEKSPSQLLSEDDYDRYIYVRDGKNRVAVKRILKTSAADQAGIEVGDIVFRYNGQRIYSPNDLYSAQAAEISTSLVSVEIKRQGQLLQYSLPKNALGVMVTATTEVPE